MVSGMTNKIIALIVVLLAVACGGSIGAAGEPAVCKADQSPPYTVAAICGSDRVVFSCSEPAVNPGNCAAAPEIPGYPEPRAQFWCC